MIPHRQVGQVSCGFFLNCVELRVIRESHTVLKGCALFPMLPNKWDLWYMVELKIFFFPLFPQFL